MDVCIVLYILFGMDIALDIIFCSVFYARGRGHDDETGDAWTGHGFGWNVFDMTSILASTLMFMTASIIESTMTSYNIYHRIYYDIL